MKAKATGIPVVNLDTNIGELKELLDLAVTQVEQLQKTIDAINGFGLTTNLTDA